MDLAEDMMKYVLSYVMENCPNEMAFFNQFYDKELLERLHHIVSSDFVRLPYTEAVKLLEEHKDEFEYPVFWGCDLQTEHERYLTEKVFKKPVFVTDYPKEIKAFYMRLNDDGKTVALRTCWFPALAKSSAAASVRSATTCCSTASASWDSTRRIIPGTSTCANTAAPSTPATVWALSA